MERNMGEKTYEVTSREEIEGLTLGEVMDLPFDFDTDPRHRFGIFDSVYCARQGLNEAIERELSGLGKGKSSISISAASASIVVKLLMDGRLTKLADGERKSLVQQAQGGGVGELAGERVGAIVPRGDQTLELQ
jgi:hypothetical protein